METLNSIQFRYPESMSDESVPSGIREGFRRAHELYGTGDVDRLFGGSPTTPAPWPRAPRRKSEPLFDQGRVTEELRRAPHLEDVDPRNLHASQPSVVRHHVDYYMGENYRTTGETSADQSNVGNQYPMVYENRRGQRILLAGHHRATRDLLLGQPLRARVVRE